MFKIFRVSILGIFLACLITTCGPKPVTLSKHPPIILISIDTLRSDHLACYGYKKGHTPILDEFSRESIQFEHAFSHIPLTLPSHTTLMTGLLPEDQGVRDNLGFTLKANERTLAGYLGSMGYQTAGFVSAKVLGRETGINQGFEWFDDQFEIEGMQTIQPFSERPGNETIEKAVKWLQDKEPKLPFVFVHLFDPHAPYRPPASFSPSVENPYDQEIEFVDQLLGDFFDFLKVKGIYNDALIVVLSDHGEGLGDHGEDQHGLTLYRETIQVPLIIKLPNQRMAGKRIPENVGLMDVSATIASLLGGPPIGQGRTLIREQPLPSDQVYYSETLSPSINYGWYESRSIIKGDKHAMMSDQERVFNWESDPQENNDQFPQSGFPLGVQEMLTRSSMSDGSAETMTSERMEQLRSLGYTSGNSLGPCAQQLSEKDFLQLIRTLAESSVYLKREQYQKVYNLISPILETYPNVLDTCLLVAKSQAGLGRLEEAKQTLLQGLSTHSMDLQLQVALIDIEFRLHNWESGLSLSRRVLRLAPESGPGLLLPILYTQDVFPMAVQVANKVLSEYPKSGLAICTLARQHVLKRNFEAAKTQILNMLADLEREPDLNLEAEGHFILADLYANQNQAQKALDSFYSALACNPNHEKANAYLTLLLVSLDRREEAANHLRNWTSRFATPKHFEKAKELCRITGMDEELNYYANQMEVSSKNALNSVEFSP